ncbi:tetrathionate reductase subunit A [Arhodomonas sp. KWT2]|uniref:tetrathionate reductase subunit A n=1 Tax=Arhodomonas sp. KWT2 TaxID=3344194 RepID=UPI0035C21C4C
MDKTRRNLLKGGLAAGGLGVFAAGYAGPAVNAVRGLVRGTAGVPTQDRIAGNALPPECHIDPETGAVTMAEGQVVSLTQCFGCWTLCGVRARVDTTGNRILRIAGNPYNPLSHERPEAYTTPVREAFARLGGESGLGGRSTACARGAAMLEQLTSPYRVTRPLKRVGPRGSGRWQRISFEQLVEEVVEGGDLFGEGHVDGLRAVRDLDTPVAPESPEYGPRANQLLFTTGANEGRDALVRRFTFNAFGSRNYGHHGAYCGFAFRAGSGAWLNDMRKYAHVKPDWEHVRFALFMGTAPAQSGKPFKLQGRQLASARAEGRLDYVVVSPALPNSSSLASQPGNTWLPVRPGGDTALAMAMIRWIIDHERYDARHLAQPGPAAMAAAGEPSWGNATHLVISEPGHPSEGRLLRGSDLGWPADGDDEVFVVADASDGHWRAHTAAAPARLFVDTTVTLDGSSVRVKSALQRLREEAERFTLAEYSAECGVPVAAIEALARTFTSYGKQAVVDAHGGLMSGNGFYSAFAVMMLNALVGNLNARGGTALAGGHYPEFGRGPRYDLKTFPGMVKPKGVFLSRSRFPYEKTSEYRRKVEAGESPYPARAPWYPFSPPILTEHLASALAGYPYPAKVWINHMANPLYGQAGLRSAVAERLKDPQRLPLMVGVDAFINETNAFADYIVPDTITYESWGFTAPWSGVRQKTSTARWPVVEPRTARTADGEPVALESFLVAAATRLGLPGFGDDAIPDADGGLHGFHRAADFYLRAVANVAHVGEPVPEADDDDLAVTGVTRLEPDLTGILTAGEWRRAAYVLARGGRFGAEPEGDALPRWERGQCLWNETVAAKRHAVTGERFSGCPTWYPARLADGSDAREAFPAQSWPFRLTAYKSNLQSSSSIGSPRLRQVHPENPVGINRRDAERLGIANGEAVMLVTPGGRVSGVALLRDGVMPGVLAVEHGYGHRELGARAHVVDGRETPHDPALGAGVNLNDLGIVDPTREAPNGWVDWACGSAVRQALPARLERAT